MGYTGSYEEERTIALGQIASALQGIETAANAIHDRLTSLNARNRYEYVIDSGGDGSAFYRIERATGRIWVLKHIHENWAHHDLPQKRWEPLNIEPEG